MNDKKGNQTHWCVYYLFSYGQGNVCIRSGRAAVALFLEEHCPAVAVALLASLGLPKKSLLCAWRGNSLIKGKYGLGTPKRSLWLFA